MFHDDMAVGAEVVALRVFARESSYWAILRIDAGTLAINSVLSNEAGDEFRVTAFVTGRPEMAVAGIQGFVLKPVDPETPLNDGDKLTGPSYDV